jgi:hypothetical protein
MRVTAHTRTTVACVRGPRGRRGDWLADGDGFWGASRLVVDNAALFGTGIGGTSYLGSQLENFGTGDSIDLHNFSASGLTLAYDPSSGLLQFSNGGALATLDFQQSTLGADRSMLTPTLPAAAADC